MSDFNFDELDEVVRSTPSIAITGGLLGRLAKDRHITVRGRKVSYEHLLTLSMLGRTGWAMYKKAKAYSDARHSYTLSIDSDDLLFDAMMPWVLANVPSQNQRMLTVAFQSRRRRLNARSDYYPSSSSERFSDVGLDVAYDGKRNHKVTIDGHTVRVRLEEQEKPERKPNVDSMILYGQPQQLVFEASTPAGRDAVLELLVSTVEALQVDATKRAGLWTMNSYGSWDGHGRLPERPLSSVVTTGDQVERVRQDVETFLANKDRYFSVSAPYHRGYLFHGPPGTGKTSLARAIASHFNLDLHYMPLASVKSDADLSSLVAQIGGMSGLLLLEDVDVFHSTRDRTDDKGVTLSGLLNALDGVATPSGLITIMTTNERSVLDDAIVRPGRVDMEIEMGLVGPREVERIFEMFYGTEAAMAVFGRLPDDLEIAPAMVTSPLLANMDDPLGAIKQLEEALS